MNDLRREQAPLSERAWAEVEGQARRVLATHLAARRLVELEGPHGWTYAAVSLGRSTAIEGGTKGVRIRSRRVRPLLELHVPFELERSELDAIDRGALETGLDAVADAARRLAAAEDAVAFEGVASLELPGLVSHAAHEPIPFPADPARVPIAVARALDRLRRAGVEGPYALALGPEAYATVSGASEDGYPVLRHVREIVGSAPVWAPTLAGGLLASQRGGDFALVCGRDASIGYEDHDASRVLLYLEESIALRLPGPEALVPLPAG